MSYTQLRLGDQGHAAELLRARQAAITEVLRTLELDLAGHVEGFGGAGGASFRAAAGAWLDAAARLPAQIGRFAHLLATAEAQAQRSQQEQAEIFDRVARSLGGPA